MLDIDVKATRPDRGPQAPNGQVSKLERVRAYLQDLVTSKRALPATASRPDKPCMKLVAEEANVPLDAVARSGSPCQQLVVQSLPLLGVEVRLRPRMNTDHTLHDLKHLSVARLRFEGECEATDYRQPCCAMTNALDRLAAVCGGPMTPAQEALDRIRAAGSDSADLVPSPADEKLLTLAREYLTEAQAGLGAPGNFHTRLCFECALVGVAPHSLARLASVSSSIMTRFADGKRIPGKGKIPGIHRVEHFLRLQEGTLADLVERKHDIRGRIKRADLPAGLSRYQFERLVKALPEDYSNRPETEKVSLLVRAQRSLRDWDQSPAGGLAAQRRDRYALKEWPEHLEDEWKEVVKFRRPKRLVFGTMSRKSGWNDESVKIWRHRFGLFFGFLVNKLHELENIEEYQTEEYRKKGPVKCLEPEALSFALLTQKELVIGYMRWLVWRKAQFKREKRITHTDLEFVHECKRLTRRRPANV